MYLIAYAHAVHATESNTDIHAHTKQLSTHPFEYRLESHFHIEERICIEYYVCVYECVVLCIGKYTSILGVYYADAGRSFFCSM